MMEVEIRVKNENSKCDEKLHKVETSLITVVELKAINKARGLKR